MKQTKQYLEQGIQIKYIIYLKNIIYKGEDEDDCSIRKSKQWNIQVNSRPEEVYIFETQIYNDDTFVISLTNSKDEEIHYEIVYNFDDIAKAFQVLPQSYKDHLCTLIDYQVFISGLLSNNKLELFLAKYNRLKLEFKDIAKAPKGAMYNVTIMVPKA